MLPHLCPHGECINSLDSFRCHCQAGYAPDTTATACLGEPPAPFSEPLLTAPGTHFHEKTKSRKQSSFVSFLHPTLFGPLFSCYLVHPKIFNYIQPLQLYSRGSSKSGSANSCPKAESGPLLVLLIKFYCHTAMPVCLLTLWLFLLLQRQS